MLRRTKIVATLGPASSSRRELADLLAAGTDVVRLGLAHGELAEHQDRIGLVRELAEAAGRPVAVLADLPGPKLRAGELPEGGAFLAEGDPVELVTGPADAPSRPDRLTVDAPRLREIVAPGDAIVLGDGAVTLAVQAGASSDGPVRTVVRSGGRLQGRPGVHLPSGRWVPPVPTPEDLRLVAQVASAVDWVAVSFVRTADELRRVRQELGAGGPRLMAKIETRAAVGNLDDILAAADGAMVARGDLGIDCAIEEVPQLQKDIIRACAARGLPVVTATQMLESMVSAPSPTRAEASDVANAVIDGTDALMLSAETAIGHDPPRVVRMMARIAGHAEQADERRIPAEQLGLMDRRQPDTSAVTVAMAHAALRASCELDLAAVVCCTRTGATARAMAALRPPCRLLGASTAVQTARQLALSYGVEPFVVPGYATTDEMVERVVGAVRERGVARPGEAVAVLAGAPDSPARATDTLRVVTVE